MKVVVRVDASMTIGLGHLSRCLTLAHALAKRGATFGFAIRTPEPLVRQWVERQGHQVIALDGSEPESVATLRATAGADLVVLDGYTFGADLHDVLLAAGRKLCVIDDGGARPVHATFVLNGNLYAETLRYDAVPRCLLGPSYALVRDEFVAARAVRVSSARGHQGAPRVLVTMGGADPVRATEAFLAEVGVLPRADIRVVVGGANPRADAILRCAAAVSAHHVTVIEAAENMAELMAWSDVTVAAAGSTCLELACVGVASVVFAAADNQIPVAAELASRRMMWSAGNFGDLAPGALAEAAARLLADASARANMERIQRATVDGLGQQRVAAALLDAGG